MKPPYAPAAAIVALFITGGILEATTSATPSQIVTVDPSAPAAVSYSTAPQVSTVTAGVAIPDATPAPPPPPARRLNNAQQVTPTQPPPSTVPVPDSAKCPQFWQLAADVGWPEDELWHLDRVIYAESRCDPDAFNGSGGDRSHGLMQINVKKSSGNQSLVGPLVDWDWSRLFDPATNLRVGLHIADYVESDLGWCRWRPWTTRDRSVCG